VKVPDGEDDSTFTGGQKDCRCGSPVVGLRVLVAPFSNDECCAVEAEWLGVVEPLDGLLYASVHYVNSE
jgi:hypothetical protein